MHGERVIHFRRVIYFSSAVTFPLDIVKTRLQVSRQLSGSPRVGLVGTAASLGEERRGGGRDMHAVVNMIICYRIQLMKL